MRPAIGVFTFQFIVSALAKKAADRHMHEVLFLFFGKIFPDLAKFLDTDEEQDGFQVGFLPKPLYQLGFEGPPAGLEIVLKGGNTRR